MEDLLADFLIDASISLDVIDLELIKLAEDTSNKTALENILRHIHTIKGTCGFLQLPRLEKITHSAETLLVKLYGGDVGLSAEHVSLLSTLIEDTRCLLSSIRANGTEPKANDIDLIEALIQASNGHPIGLETLVRKSSKASWIASQNTDALVIEDRDDALAIQTSKTSEPMDAQPAPLSFDVSHRKTDDPVLSSQSAQVSASLLDALYSSVADLTFTQQKLGEVLKHRADASVKPLLKKLSTIAAELGDLVEQTRTQPIGNAWQRLPRLVSHLAQELGKKIDFRMIGAEIQLDRTVVELLKDPLLHLIRNSCDHGLEPPDERTTNGKPVTGQLLLRSSLNEGQVTIELEDDGRGLDFEKIRKQVVRDRRGCRSEVDGMSNDEVCTFLFHAGFSTADDVTKISGRGVGMDVVRANIEQIGGTVELSSLDGLGTKIAIRIPQKLGEPTSADQSTPTTARNASKAARGL